MRSVADDLRRLTRARVLTMTPAARIDLALALGEDDLALFARTAGLEPQAARRRLRARRSRGRAPSVANLHPER
jgi:hypothetical protein